MPHGWRTQPTVAPSGVIVNKGMSSEVNIWLEVVSWRHQVRLANCGHMCCEMGGVRGYCCVCARTALCQICKA